MRWIERYLRRWQARLERHLKAYELPRAAGLALPQFSRKEQQALLAKAREYVAGHFSGQSVAPLNLGDKTDALVALDVAFWVRGELRASMILADGLPLQQALEQCTERSLHDGRFRPLTQDELAELRIELTFFGSWTELLGASFQSLPIEPDHGFVACVDGAPRAWYLPMVHNALRFDTLPELVESLLFRKGRLGRTIASRATIFHFPTQGFIEKTPDGEEALALDGPLVKQEKVPDTTKLFERSLAWLLDQEVAPGVFSPQQTLGGARTSTMDWPRTAFVGAVLAEVGKHLGRPELVQAAERVNTFLKRELTPALGVDTEAKALAAIYAGLAAISLGEHKTARLWREEAERLVPLPRLNPIAKLHGAKLLALVGEVARAQGLFDEAFARWQRDRDHIQLALFPELLPLALTLWEKTTDQRYLEWAEAVGDWYAAHQNRDGSFPFAPRSNRAPYLRGSGKILEALACLPERYSEAIKRGLAYAAKLQYTEANAFHVRASERSDFLGGFRHDAFNREAWIDAAGHVLLALVRTKHRGNE